MAVKPIPAGYHSVTPYLVAKDAPGLIKFLTNVFGATPKMNMDGPDGMIMHAEVVIGDSAIMCASECEHAAATTTMLYVYVADVDDVYQRGIQAGAKSVMEPADQFYGDRTGCFKDSFGNQWTVAKHVEDVAPEEVKRRAADFTKKQAAGSGSAS